MGPGYSVQNIRMLVSVVNLREPKLLCGSSRSGYGTYGLLRHGHITLPAYRADLTYRVIPTEQDKSVSLPSRESTSQDGPMAVRT
jgi:hypothetical protein